MLKAYTLSTFSSFHLDEGGILDFTTLFVIRSTPMLAASSREVARALILYVYPGCCSLGIGKLGSAPDTSNGDTNPLKRIMSFIPFSA